MILARNKRLPEWRKRRVRERAFTLVELGVVVGVIAVLATVVLVGRGFIEQSRLATIATVVKTLQEGARAWALRVNAGASYVGINLNMMKGERIIPCNPIPGGNPPPGPGWAGCLVNYPFPAVAQPTVAPAGAGNFQFVITVCVPAAPAASPTAAQDLTTILTNAGGGTAVQAGNCVNITAQ